MSINIDGRDCCQTGQFSQDVADGALTNAPAPRCFKNRSPSTCTITGFLCLLTGNRALSSG
ncbi:hypothetical protein D1220_20925 [Klebsiella pneumoniae]|nr:hypothetical protein D1220_20925 [Klebsiella pneumoniae]